MAATAARSCRGEAQVDGDRHPRWDLDHPAAVWAWTWTTGPTTLSSMSVRWTPIPVIRRPGLRLAAAPVVGLHGQEPVEAEVGFPRAGWCRNSPASAISLDLLPRPARSAAHGPPQDDAARSQAVSMRRALSAVRASGFSQNTCLPASAPRTTASSCRRCGIVKITASICAGRRAPAGSRTGRADRAARGTWSPSPSTGRPRRRPPASRCPETLRDLVSPPAEPTWAVFSMLRLLRCGSLRPLGAGGRRPEDTRGDGALRSPGRRGWDNLPGTAEAPDATLRRRERRSTGETPPAGDPVLVHDLAHALGRDVQLGGYLGEGPATAVDQAEAIGHDLRLLLRQHRQGACSARRVSRRAASSSGRRRRRRG